MNWPHALRSLAHRDLRLFLTGQAVSTIGTWMQSVAQAWLVYRLTRSAEMLGVISFLGQVPTFLFGLYAGSLADRLPRRTIVLATQINATVQAALLAAITLGGWVRPWHVIVLAFMLGLTWAFEMPARHALIGELGGVDMPNALALNSTVFNASRLVGPAVAGFVVAAVGEGWCFAINAVSFAGTIYALLIMRDGRSLSQSGREKAADGGIRYALRTPLVRALLALLATSSFFAMSYATLLPIFAAEILGGGPALLGGLHAAAGLGAFAAALTLLGRKGVEGLYRWVPTGAALLGGGLTLMSLSRHPLLSQAAMVATGFGFITQIVGTTTLLQHLTPPELRGRVMGLFSTLFVGVAPFGALAAGLFAHRIGAPLTMGAGAAVVLLGGVAFHLSLARLRGYPGAPCPPPSPSTSATS